MECKSKANYVSRRCLDILRHFRFIFTKGHVSKDWDVFGCFTNPPTDPEELEPMGPTGLKKYNSTDEGGPDDGAAAAATNAVPHPHPPKHIRKPDPSLRILQRQLSQDLPVLGGLGSLKKQKSKDASGGGMFITMSSA